MAPPVSLLEINQAIETAMERAKELVAEIVVHATRTGGEVGKIRAETAALIFENASTRARLIPREDVEARTASMKDRAEQMLTEAHTEVAARAKLEGLTDVQEIERMATEVIQPALARLERMQEDEMKWLRRFTLSAWEHGVRDLEEMLAETLPPVPPRLN